MTTIKPATPLPWTADADSVDVITEDGDFIATTLQPDSGVGMASEYQDAAYIAHACNAYPELVAALLAIRDASPTIRNDAALRAVAAGALAKLGEGA